MDSKQFTQIARNLTHNTSRRGLLTRLSALPLGAALAILLDEEVSEAGRRKRRKARHRHNARQRKADRKRKQRARRKDRNKDKGKPPICAGCSATQLCDDGVCQDCDVCHNGCPHNAVQQAVDAASPGATIRICSGTYLGEVSIDKDVTLAGAGSEATFLIANNANDASVVTVAQNTTVGLNRLQLAEAREVIDGGGLHNQGDTTLTDCIVTQNEAQRGGGIYNGVEAKVTLVNTDVTNNTADRLVQSGQGGGIFNDRGFIQMTGGTVSGNKALRENAAGGGIFSDPNDPTARVTLTNSSVTNNNPNNCTGSVNGCIN